jgi:hypothetical protein
VLPQYSQNRSVAKIINSYRNSVQRLSCRGSTGFGVAVADVGLSCLSPVLMIKQLKSTNVGDAGLSAQVQNERKVSYTHNVVFQQRCLSTIFQGF